MPKTIASIELALVARGNGGDREAVGRLFAMHATWVKRLAQKFTGNDHDAEDVGHDTFIYLLSKFPGFTLRAPLRSFLYPAIKHRSFTLLRRRRRHGHLVGTERIADRTLAPPATGDWRRLMELLPDHERAVIARRFGRGLALLEIAEELDIPIGTVKSRMHKALHRLRGQLAA